jgi:hypothetical protein
VSKTSELYKDEIAVCRTDPTVLITGGFLSIKTKDMQLKPLSLNSAQKILFKKILELIEQKKPVRLWVLKARQEGVSTFVEALIYAVTSQKHNRTSLIMADEKEHSTNLFEMSKLYQEQLDKNYKHLAPELKQSNEKKLIFDKIHSQIIIATSENLEAARSGTYQLVHLSEVAYFRDLRSVLAGLNQTVPELPNTMIIGETTANGMDMFYDEWMKAIEGKTSWIPVFLPWFLMAEYSLPLQNGSMHPIKGISFSSDYSEKVFLEQEKQLKEEYNLTDEQINWRRYTIINKCNGSVVTFNKEYPACWQDAFQLSGSCFFDQTELKNQVKAKPIAVGEIFKERLKYDFRAGENGRMKIYEHPRAGEQYILTADASEALGQDEGSILVINSRTNKTVAVANGQYPPEDLADMGIRLGYYYNNAIAAPESKGYGYMVIKLMMESYGNMYYMKKDENGKMIEDKTKPGFNTNSSTRPMYLAQLAQEIKENSAELLDSDMIDQHYSFIIDPKSKKPQAAPSKQDGLVICRAIATQVRIEHPYKLVASNGFKQTRRQLGRV